MNKQTNNQKPNRGTTGRTSSRTKKVIRKRKRRKGLLIYVFDFFKGIGSSIKNFIYSDFLEDRRKRIVFLYVVLICFLATITYFLTKKNAYQVTVNENFVCNIPFDKELTVDSITKLAIDKLKAEVGTNVLVNEKLKIEKIHASKKDLINIDMGISKIYANFTYKIEATEINVNGNNLAILRNEEEAANVLKLVQNKYPEENQNVVYGFLEDVGFSKRYVNLSELDSADTAFELLTATNETNEIYTAIKGDSLSVIAQKNNLTQEALLASNPEISITSPVKIGQQFNIKGSRPILSVTSSYETKRKEVVKFETEKRENPLQKTTYEKIIQQGIDGEAEITEKMTKINGILSSTEEVSMNIIKSPINKIIEVGTKN